MGPPIWLPFSSTSRKRTASTASEYLVAIPTSAVHHIQNSAPGPPTKIAVATPAMLPVPMVAESEVIRALKGLTSPLTSLPLPGVLPDHSKRKPLPNLRIGRSLRPKDRYKPTPRIMTSMGMPHTKPLIDLTNSVTASIQTSSMLRKVQAISVPGQCRGTGLAARPFAYCSLIFLLNSPAWQGKRNDQSTTNN
ncbi:hypothetical protein STH12_04236 [Shewanella khirikhana]|uniref:Uncharacterized protein n=1 Tax=Shewanella khirikhana TaxID=1965282 RepID=A0ABN5U0S8_9GAMM|nr:hypothetical protein STH12_04236 [Shewanella khirikhana]